MKLRQVPASRGAAWVRHGFGVFARRPLAFAALFTAFLFFALVSAMLPLVGPLLMLASLPLVSLGFMRATQHTLQGRFPTLAVFVSPLPWLPAIASCSAWKVPPSAKSLKVITAVVATA